MFDRSLGFVLRLHVTAAFGKAGPCESRPAGDFGSSLATERAIAGSHDPSCSQMCTNIMELSAPVVHPITWIQSIEMSMRVRKADATASEAVSVCVRSALSRHHPRAREDLVKRTIAVCGVTF